MSNMFTCECCGKTLDVSESAILPNSTGPDIWICKKCDATINKGKRYDICNCCGEVFDICDLVVLFHDDGTETNLCSKCDGRENVFLDEPRTDAHHHTVYEKDDPTVDIHKIIDDAMEKGDRSVSIMIHDGITSVEVRPYEEERPKWLHMGNGHFKCSDCGNDYDANCDPLPVYCGYCGEKLYGVKDMLEDDDEEET